MWIFASNRWTRATLVCLMLGIACLAAPPPGPAPVPGRDAVSESASEVPSDFLSQAQSHLAEREYWASETSEGLQAPNREHGLRSYFEERGVRVHDRTAAGSPRLLSLELSGLGRGDALASVPTGEVTHAEGRVEIARKDLGLIEWFENTEAGLEQGFTLETRPAYSGRSRGREKEELIVELVVSGAESRLLGKEICLKTETGRSLSYGKLEVVDAKGQTLAAHFEVPAPDRIRLLVDDRGAAYPLVIDPLLSRSYDALVESGDPNAQLGTSAEFAGDVNGDGYDDVIVGAPLIDIGQTNEGAFLIFHGGPTGIGGGDPFNADRLVQSDQPNAQFGYSVDTAGDVNGDGYADVVAGAPFFDNDLSTLDEGAAFVYLGSATGITGTTVANAHARIESNQRDAWLGLSVSGAGDVNGDGFGDLIVGSIFFDAVPNNEGIALIFLGSPTGIPNGNPATAHAQLESNQAGSQFGIAVASAGDVDADGFGDVIVGASTYTVVQSQEGAAFVFRGSAAGIPHGNPATAHATFRSDQLGAQLGFSVASAGDVNGDGYSDVAMGALNYNVGFGADNGLVLVFHGSATGLQSGSPVTANRSITGELSGDNFGRTVGGGDVNGDGYSDLFVGAMLADATNGRLSVYFGGALGILPPGKAPVADYVLAPGIVDAHFGGSASAGGDVNGDGYDDLLVGAPLFDGPEVDEGAAFVFHGGAAGFSDGSPATAHAQLEGIQQGALMGVSVASAGDVNGDGYGDVIVGAASYDAGDTGEGAAFVFLGSGTGISDGNPLTAHAQLESNQDGARMGASVASAGDVNGDGYGDVIVGAFLYDAIQPNEGAAFVFLGSVDGIDDGNPLTAHAQLESNQDGATMGASVASAGDVNGDGYGDVIVGAHLYDAIQPDEGVAFVFLGSVTGIDDGNPLTAHAQLESNQGGARMGLGVASAGDVNGDGFGDVIVGAFLYDAPDLNEGAAFVFLGSATGIDDGNPLTAHAQLESNQVGAQMGFSTASAGDVNGDGYSDVIVGAHLYDAIQPDEGVAFVFLGSVTGMSNGNPLTAHAQLESNQDNAQLGLGVASAGDVNGDGYGDVIVGALGYDAGDPDEGAAFVFLGSAAGIDDGNPLTAHAQLESNQPRNLNTGFNGESVASAGDVNGDGYGDVIVGSLNYRAGDGVVESGAAFIYTGNSEGRPTLARQRWIDPSARERGAQPGGAVFGTDSFTAELVARSPRGRERARIEFELCPVGVAFGNIACTTETTASWVDLGTTGALFRQTLSGLALDQSYSWRARTLFAPVSSTQPGIVPMVRVGPWFRMQGRAMVGDIRRVPEPGIGIGLALGVWWICMRAKRSRRPTRRFA